MSGTQGDRRIMKHQEEFHVVYIVTKLELGGAQKVCLSLFNGLQEHGCSSTLISGSEGKLVASVQPSPNVILLDAFKREVSIFGIVQEFKAFIHLARVLTQLRKKHPNLIVHTHSTKAGIIGRWAAFFAGVKQRVHTIHGYGFHKHQSIMGWLARYVPELFTSFITTHFVCVSSEDIKTGIRLFPFFSVKYSLIRAAVEDEQFFAPATGTTWQQPELFLIGTISCFKPQKNLLDLFNAFAQVHKKFPHTRLEVIGDGMQRPQLEQWIRENNLEHAIILHGWQNDVVKFMSRWQIFALSSLWEGLPCAIVEARLMKLPVVCYDTGGIRDVIFHGENGLLCKQKEWQQLAQNLQQLIENPKQHMRMQSFCDNLHDFSRQHMVNDHLSLYQSLQ